MTVVEKTGTLHRVWFPLRSNATYFEGPRHSLDLEARIKQAALLCEELVFEFGMLDVTVTKHGMWSFWIPPNQLSEGDTSGAGAPPRRAAPCTSFWVTKSLQVSLRILRRCRR